MADLRGIKTKFDRGFACTRMLSTSWVRTSSIVIPIDSPARWRAMAGIGSAGNSRLRFPPLEQFALIFGDMLYNLRASLDYIVWQLVEVNGATLTGAPPSHASRTP
jgi:hypothetical protein